MYFFSTISSIAAIRDTELYGPSLHEMTIRSRRLDVRLFVFFFAKTPIKFETALELQKGKSNNQQNSPGLLFHSLETTFQTTIVTVATKALF